MTKEKTVQIEYPFEADVQRVLSLVINSLYTNSEVFVRELVSNASDALDKARFVALSDKEGVREQEGEPAIDIVLDREKNTLSIEDNGVGMTRDEVIENLGTIARSGTDVLVRKFAELTRDQDRDEAIELIGKFGVGFYAAFMVAKRVDVHTLSMRKGAEPVLWRSDGSGSFSVLAGERERPGTRVVLHLQQDAGDFAQRWRVEQVVKKYSDFVMFPIRIDGEVVNTSSAPWRKAPGQVSEEQHAELFKRLTGGRAGERPAATVHLSVDAPVQFSALLYVPDKATPELFAFHKERPGLRLYARRVLVMESCEGLTPVYLRFVRGVVDSEDLPLNISRETLQNSRAVKQIEQQLTKQVLKQLERLAEQDEARYLAFFRELGPVLKEGISLDFKNRDRLAKLCRFETLRGEAGALISLDRYLGDKPEAQQEIWYITGTDRQQLERSPHLEAFRSKGFDVLLLTDPIDEWVVSALGKYQGHALESAVHGELELGDEDERSAADQARLEAAVQAVAKALGDRVGQVRLSRRLTETASCLVSREGDPGANLERLMKMLDQRAEQKARILELNPSHPVVVNLAALVERDPQAEAIGRYSELLYHQALLSEGVVENPAEVVRLVQELLVESSGRAVER